MLRTVILILYCPSFGSPLLFINLDARRIDRPSIAGYFVARNFVGLAIHAADIGTLRLHSPADPDSSAVIFSTRSDFFYLRCFEHRSPSPAVPSLRLRAPLANRSFLSEATNLPRHLFLLFFARNIRLSSIFQELRNGIITTRL